MTTITTSLGPITGVERQGILGFRGVRYGRPPTQDRRFRAPEPAGRWAGTYDATRFGPRAAQVVDPAQRPIGEPDEDCLFLNIYTPAADDAARPVMVWIHGGGNINGSANDYDGSVLAAQGDVVVVCINYRVGFLGFADLSSLGDEYAGSAANGYRDQTLALTWVRDNIADYGGDPDNVTIFGESAGGGGVLAQIASPAADGLFHKAIGFSPGGMSTPSVDTVGPIARTLDIAPDAVPEALLAMSTDEVLDVQARSGYTLGGGYDGLVVPGPVTDAIARRGADGVPILVGSNRDEATLFTMAAPDDADQLRAIRRAIARSVTFGEPVDGYLDRLSRRYAEADDAYLNHLVWVDRYRRISVEVAAAATAAGPGGWLYRFDFPTTVLDGALGATHSCDVPFTFNAFASERRDQIQFYDGDDQVAGSIAAAWSATMIAFARTGDPNGAGLPDWPRYDLPARRSLRVDAVSEVVDDIDDPHRHTWTDAVTEEA